MRLKHLWKVIVKLLSFYEHTYRRENHITNSIKPLRMSSTVSTRARSIKPGIEKSKNSGAVESYILCCRYFGSLKFQTLKNFGRFYFPKCFTSNVFNHFIILKSAISFFSWLPMNQRIEIRVSADWTDRISAVDSTGSGKGPCTPLLI